MTPRTLAIIIATVLLTAVAAAACVPIYGLGPGDRAGGYARAGDGRMDPWKGYTSIDYCGLICW